MQTGALHGRVVGTLKIPVDCVCPPDTEVPLIDRQLFFCQVFVWDYKSPACSRNKSTKEKKKIFNFITTK